MKIKVNVEAVFQNTFIPIAENVGLDMREFNEINNRTLLLALERQHPEVISLVPTWKWRQVTFRAGLDITITEEE